MTIELGYIGRKIANEFQEINLDAVPYMTTLNGQTFANAWATVYNQICAGAGPTCTPNTANVTAQPFFEAALGGPGSAYCAGSPNCTAAMVKNEASNIKATNVYQVWVDLAQKSSWVLARSLLAQPGAGQQLTGAFDFINSLGHGNYNAGFVSFTAHDWHGLTARSNFTWGKSLGTGSVVQASSSISVPDPYNFKNFGTYGVQPFDVKYTYSLLMLYQSPFFKRQKGIAGRILGGWTIAPLFTARSGLPLRLSTSSNGEDFGEVYSGQTANYEQAAGLTPFTGGNSPNYNVQTTGLCAGTSGNHRPQYLRESLHRLQRIPPPDSRRRHEFRRRGLAARLRILEPRRHHLQGLQSHRAHRRHPVLPVREHLEPLRAGRSRHQYRFAEHVRRRDQPVHYPQWRAEPLAGVWSAPALLITAGGRRRTAN